MTPTLPQMPSAFPTPGPLVYALRAAFAIGGRVAPAPAARLAEHLFCRPPRLVLRPPEAEFLAAATPGFVTVRHHQVVTYTWEAAGPTIVLMHGWGSYAGRWRTIGGALHAAGFRIVALDGPGHGATGGHSASLPEFAEAMAAVAAREGTIYAAVGHSLGASAIPVAMHYKGLQTSRAVLIAPPSDPGEYAGFLQRFLWWPDAVHDRMIAQLEARLGHQWSDFPIPALAAGRTESALLIHDVDDADVPHTHGAAIAEAWPGLIFETTRGLGHRNIMRDNAVADRIVQFLTS